MKKRGTQYTPVLQSETKRFPTLGLYHWDVSDSHNIEMAGESLEHLRKLTLRRMKDDGRYTVPASQNDYWALIFHATLGIMSHRYRLATKLRIISLLYSREKLIHVHMDDLHKPILSLFCFDADFGNAPVFHALKLTEGGGATETVATRGDAVVIEEIRLALEVDGSAVDGKRAR